MDEACINLMQIDVPETESTPNNLLAFDRYPRAVHAIQEFTNSAYKQNCIVCRGQHHFENCTTLNDHDFLKQHYIRFCQNVRRDQAELARQAQAEQVNFMDRDPYENVSGSNNDEDFLHGNHKIRCSVAVPTTSNP